MPKNSASPARWRPQVGPGFIVAAAFLGPGTVMTALSVGAEWGLSLWWVILLSTLATMVLQEMAARLGTLSSQGLGELLRRQSRSGRSLVAVMVLVVTAIGLGNAVYQTGNLVGGGLGVQTFVSTSASLAILPIAVLASALLWLGSYRAIERCMIGLVGLMGVVFLLAAIIAVGQNGIGVSELVPSASRGSLVSILALIGATIVPYNLFLHASAASRRWAPVRPRGEGLRRSRLDSMLGIAVGGLVIAAIFTMAAVAIPGGRVDSIAELAAALQPVLGDTLAGGLIGLGFCAAGLATAITAPLAAAYAVCGVCGWSTEERSPRFRGVWGAIMVIAALVAIFRGSAPGQTLVFAEAANAVLLPIAGGFLLMACNARILGKYANGRFANVSAALALGLVVGLSIRKIVSIFM